ncbi:MAG: esterase [Bacillota bacterium]|nr:esterase [Bacillota bacterium]
METYILEKEEASFCIVEILGEHNREHLEKRVQYYQQNISVPFSFVGLIVESWNHDLSPWSCLNFGQGAKSTYEELMTVLSSRKEVKYILSGYSLAGLFCLWVGYQTDFFDGIVACSPSVWFPYWDTYMQEHTFLASKVYLSLGDKEHKCKNRTMREVKNRILLTQKMLNGTLEFNPGNHFQDVELRMLKGYQNVLKKGE